MKRNWKYAIGLITSIAFCFIAIGNVSGYIYAIEGEGYDSEAIYGEANDNIEINMVSSDQGINLYIMNFNAWFDYESLSDSIYDYTVDAGDNDYHGFYGDKNDKYDIEIISTSGAVSLYIADDFYNIFSDSDIDLSAVNITSGQWSWTQPNDESWYLILINDGSHDIDVEIKIRQNIDDKISWSKIGVTEGTWTWNMPTDDTYYLVIENPNEASVNTEVIISGGSFLNEGEEACGGIMIAGVILALFAILVIASFIAKKRKN